MIYHGTLRTEVWLYVPMVLASRVIPFFRLGETASEFTNVTGADQAVHGGVIAWRNRPIIAGDIPAPGQPPLKLAGQYRRRGPLGAAERRRPAGQARLQPQKAELVRRWFNGDLTPREYFPMFMRIGAVYHMHFGPWLARDVIHGAWRAKVRPEALIFAGRDLLKGWTVMDRLGEIKVPTLVVAGRDGVFPPECQRELAASIPHARRQLVDHAGHSPYAERTAEVLPAIRHFISADAPAS